MLKRNDGKSIGLDTYVYSVPVFKLVSNTNPDEEYIYIRVICENRRVFFMVVDNKGKHCFHNLSTNDTFVTQWGYNYTAYECEVDNIDIEYH